MAMDQDYQHRMATWLGFGRLLRWAVGIIIVILLGMAYFLL